MTEINLALLGPPGAGKGTQAKTLATDHGLAYVATGELLRAAVATGSETGRRAKLSMDAGRLVPDEIVFEIIGETLRRDPATSGFVLDGFPRTIAQADALDVELAKLGRSLSAAILLDVPDALLIRRLSGRRICTEQGHEYHLEFRPPSRAGTCDLDGSLLVRRDDDEPLTIRRRLAVYHDQTEPLIAHYDAADRLRRIDGMGRASEIRLRLAAAIRAPSQSSP